MDKPDPAVVAADMEQRGDMFEEGVFNDQQIEERWAMLAGKYAETYAKLLENVDVTKLEITGSDEWLYTEFRALFPDLRVDILDMHSLKTEENKAKWRPFLDGLKGKVAQHDTGALVRVFAKGRSDVGNLELVPRGQFYCIEVARIKEGVYTK
ncbi:uncharacterised protein family UPF0368, metazoa/fungi [Kipferlia bialata]|uniref:Polysaccharide biosynthesis domain-containing protein n=1 Tax=Kipferlia bialata TaxID=797122 RepID=A0A9K3D1W8_9EUKA|nr:uncharacterised protein family UPF0368, metazoa/fungi [Kipferlia bialata]|eukprot:g9519.t1